MHVSLVSLILTYLLLADHDGFCDLIGELIWFPGGCVIVYQYQRCVFSLAEN